MAETTVEPLAQTWFFTIMIFINEVSEKYMTLYKNNASRAWAGLNLTSNNRQSSFVSAQSPSLFLHW